MELINRDISWLGFNRRVLDEAADKSLPLYERIKFLSIFSSNLDEFFRVRYPVVAAFSKLGKKTIRKESLLSEEEVSGDIQDTINHDLDAFGRILLEDIIPGLEKEGIKFYYKQAALPQHLGELRSIFMTTVLSFIQPVFLDTDSAFDFLPENNRLYLIVTISDPLKETVNRVAVNIPSDKLPRFFELSEIDGKKYVIFIDDIVRENLGLIFPGRKIDSVFSIKFNRDAELSLTEDYAGHTLEKLEKQLTKRDIAPASRFLYEKGMPSNLRMFLATQFHADLHDMFEGGRYHNLSDLAKFPAYDKNLFYPKDEPIHYPPITGGDMFSIISNGDVLLHLPYQSYLPVLAFFNQAAVDADVTEIYITLYRVAAESHIVNALISAAKNGKKVTAFIELKARFDEANNIKWSRIMKQAGVKLIYSEADIKIHSKIALVKKMIGGRSVCYSVLSTGNFNETTSLFYTDHVYLTMNKAVCGEMENLFAFLQAGRTRNQYKMPAFNELFVSRYNMLDEFKRLIEAEMEKAQRGEKGLIRMKVNNLEEPWFINLLYKASQAGVEVRMIVRSVCCLMPGKESISENISVKRIVDKYLEHTRLFIFGTNDEATVAMGSSDLMTRNLKRRIEVCLHVKEPGAKQQLLDYFDIQWQDNVKARLLDGEGGQSQIIDTGVAHQAQPELREYLKRVLC